MPLFIEAHLRCRFCLKEFTFKIGIEDFRDWQNGKLAQDAFPYLTSSEREILISSTCENCWNKLFGSESNNNKTD